MNEKPDTERRPRPDVEERSLAHVALQSLDNVATAAEYGAGYYVGKEAVAAGVEKFKDAFKPKESPVVLPPGTEE